SKIGLLDLNARTRKVAHNFCHWHFGIDRLVAEQLAISLFWILVVKETVQERGMCRIDTDFQRLQPVAVDQAFKCEGVSVWCDKAIDVRKFRRMTRPHISE